MEGPRRFRNREEAGRLLAHQLKRYAHRSDVIVLALPRGGVPVGFEIASALQLPLDVFVIRKLGVPDHEELAMGAIAGGGVRVHNDDVVQSLGLPDAAIKRAAQKEEQELHRREQRYRNGRPFPNLKNEHAKRRRPHPQPMSAPFLEFDLARELEELHREPEWENGQNAKTLVKYDDFRIVLTTLKPHRKIPLHQTNGRLSIQVVSGHVLVRAEGRTFDLQVGRIVALDRAIVHELEAVEESAVLQTIAWPTEDKSETIPPPL
jgi:quercetin dioxygenase-like cupin family protein